jgi:hypothetical protein
MRNPASVADRASTSRTKLQMETDGARMQKRQQIAVTTADTGRVKNSIRQNTSCFSLKMGIYYPCKQKQEA